MKSITPKNRITFSKGSPTATGSKIVPTASNKNNKSANQTAKKVAAPVKRGK